MTNLSVIRRSIRIVAALACGLAFGLLAIAPAQSTVVINTRGVMQKSEHGALVQHLGSVNPALPREFTVILKSASHSDALKVASYLEHFGLSTIISSRDKYIHVTGTFGAAGAAAGVGFERVRIGNETFVRITRPVQFPAAIGRLVAATSINPGIKLRSYSVVRREATIVGSQIGYGPADFANMYDINPLYASGISGRGSTIAIAACFNIDPKDIKYFQTAYGLPIKPVKVIHVDGYKDMFGNIPPPSLEPTLDVERVMGTAPNANIWLYVIPDCLVSQAVDMFERIADDANADAMSFSYGIDEADYAAGGIGDLILAQHAALQDVANQRIAEFAASGDSGSWGDPFLAIALLDVSYPASDPNMISVGGTTVAQSTIGTRLFEYAWSGSGGGVSGIWPITPYQAATPGMASGLFKNLPDVSMLADPNLGAATAFLVSFPPPIFPVGGTSVSSPTWAGVWALIAQNRRNHGHGKPVSAAALLYSVRGTHAYTDITVGANGYYPARQGYDNVTGLGVPNVAKLVNALK